MSDFTIHDIQSAPEGSKPLLEGSQKAFGSIPNLHGVMAESPQHLEAYQKLHELFQATSFTNEERTVVWQTINVENHCHYCVPAHTAIAKSQGVSDDVTNALREERPLADSRLEALRQFTLSVVREKGEVSKDDLEAFYAAGFDKRAVLDVILGLSQKVLSNYVNHIADTPVDKAFQPFAWNAGRATKAA
ncbi:carboxymuconolactone decarboxylase family protein [Parvularcula maris]|uniref:Carboxymuconolactone decarboxylase family protein n=1 Tax=Parvularcula maris TaxID=2965077 RepID=A0A9X2L814_9PROT|nr:carboxymuconolactone decarboxylase family protein [Parvularcula maris]MCQ8184791.1 carboxymuconolactone decarboxylase family protein [Parvularcula maris]